MMYKKILLIIISVYKIALYISDTSCPQDYDPHGGPNSKRCKLKQNGRSCNQGDVQCLRRPISLSFNFITLVSNLRVAINSINDMGIDLFTMQSAR